MVDTFKCLEPDRDFILRRLGGERHCLKDWVCNGCVRRDSELRNETQTNCGFTMKSGKGCGTCDGCKDEAAKIVFDAPKVESPVERYVIVATPKGFIFGKVTMTRNDQIRAIVDGNLMQFMRHDIVAESTDPQLLKGQMLQAQQLEKQLRPLWQAAIEHEIRVKRQMLDAVYAVARGE